MKEKKKALLSTLVVGLIIITGILLVLGPKKLLAKLVQGNLFIIFLAFLVELASLSILFTRWKYLINAAGLESSFLDVGKIGFAGQALNAITPSTRLGGEPLKAYLLKKKKGTRLGVAMATLVMEKIVDQAAFLLIAVSTAVFSIFFLDIPLHIILLLTAAAAFSVAVLTGMVYICFGRRIKSDTVVNLLEKHEWITDKIPFVAHYKNKMTDSLLNYYSHIAKIGSHPRVWSLGILLSLLFWTAEITRAWLLFRAFGAEVAVTVIATAYILSALIGSFPLLPGDLGIVESAMILIYSSSHINSVTSGLVTLVDRLFSYWFVIALGVPLAWYLGFTSYTGDLNSEETRTSQGLEER